MRPIRGGEQCCLQTFSDAPIRRGARLIKGLDRSTRRHTRLLRSSAAAVLPTLADELVRQRVSVLVAAGSSQAARVAKAARATIPIVFFTGGSFGRPTLKAE
jgi:hypothetical protein